MVVPTTESTDSDPMWPAWTPVGGRRSWTTTARRRSTLVRGAGAAGVGRRRQPLPRPARRHRGERARPRPPGGRRGGHRADRHARATPRTSYSTRPPSSSPSGCWDVAGPPDGPRCCSANSGAEANEAAFKLARRTGRPQDRRRRGAFHGRTMGALSSPASRPSATPFEPLLPGVTLVPYGDVDALRGRRRRRHRGGVPRADAGRGGVVAAADGYLRPPARSPRARRAARPRRGPDRGRPHRRAGSPTSTPASCPDVVTLAKGLGGGLPIGACIGVGEAGDLLGPGQHGTPSAATRCAAPPALAVLDTIDADGLLERAAALGKHSPPASRPSATRWSTRSRRAACCSASPRQPISARGHRRRPRGRLPDQQPAPDRAARSAADRHRRRARRASSPPCPSQNRATAARRP